MRATPAAIITARITRAPTNLLIVWAALRWAGLIGGVLGASRRPGHAPAECGPLGPGEGEEGREHRRPHDHGNPEGHDTGAGPGLAEGHVGVEEVVDGEHKEQHATRDLKISHRHPEKVQDGIADEQEADSDRRRRHRRLEHEATARRIVERHADPEVDEDDGDHVHRHEQRDERQEQRAQHSPPG